MCGIAGIISLNREPLQNCSWALDKMSNCIAHRGPDQLGHFISHNRFVCFTNTRLSIVGTKDTVNLPIHDIHDRACVTYNGELFNHNELRLSLQQQGCAFQTSTDTEVLLNGVLYNGLNFLDKTDGFWAFAFYDKSENKVILSRDLLGEKSLYYAIHNGRLYFASEINPILSVLPPEAIELDYKAVICSFQYRATFPGHSLISKIKKLQPGASLVITPGEADLRIAKQQKFSFETSQEFFANDPNEKQVIEKYSELLYKSCSIRLPQEVDYIATLSGGIDSTLINYFISQTHDKRHETLFGESHSVSPAKGEDISEYEASCLTSKKLNSHHHYLMMHQENASKIYEEAAANSFDGIFCEGTADFGQLAAYLNSQNKRVLVLSDGPDELLNGYPTDIRSTKVFHKFSHYPQAARSTLIKRAYDQSHMAGKSSTLLNWAYLEDTPFAIRPNHGGTSTQILQHLFSPDINPLDYKSFGRIPDFYNDVYQNLDIAQRVALGYACTSLPEYVNTRSDRGIMRQSIEARLPFQARYLVELMIATPEKWRTNMGKYSKYILRKLVETNVSKEIAYRSKYGFSKPGWNYESISQKLKMEEVIAESSVFTSLPFSKEAHEFLSRPEKSRYTWMAYCLAKTWESLNQCIKDKDKLHV
ncbi:asparagine synthase (glutamine-hydrolyzing) [Kiloniella sp. EL199]|uniref:asparagine synthase (glutamine-hydrolyzing) n=1 Tax=Kiloniella sp. EL199 TaxID=2107581 RepID=UPI000EA2DFE1|nr:asparagine synthase (glutamine-hydrolyzing) [Kiloniella sp. EL199]